MVETDSIGNGTKDCLYNQNRPKKFFLEHIYLIKLYVRTQTEESELCCWKIIQFIKPEGEISTTFVRPNVFNHSVMNYTILIPFCDWFDFGINIRLLSDQSLWFVCVHFTDYTVVTSFVLLSLRKEGDSVGSHIKWQESTPGRWGYYFFFHSRTKVIT